VLVPVGPGVRELDRARWTVKLDTDPVVLGSFADAPQEAFAGTRLGVLGRYRTGPWGEGRRDFTTLRGEVVRARIPPRTYRRNGYETGEHCLGGVYAVSELLLRRLAQAGLLDHPCDWTATQLSEDQVVGVLNRAVGCEFGDSPLFGAQLTALSIKGEDEEALRGRFASLI
jgi:hypothetical protein